MKIKLINGTQYDVVRAEVTNGRLEIDMTGITAEEMQNIFSVPEKLNKIELFTDNEEKFGELPGWTVYGGVMLVGEKKTAILTKEVNTTVERIVNAESQALEAKAIAEETASNLEEAVAELTIAMAKGTQNV